MAIVRGKISKKMWYENEHGKRVTKKYRSIFETKFGLMSLLRCIYKNSRDECILLNSYIGNVILPISDTIRGTKINDELFLFYRDGYDYLYNNRGELLLKARDISVQKEQKLILVNEDYRNYYFIDYNLKMVSDTFLRANSFNEYGYSIVQLHNNKYSVLDDSLNLLFDPIETPIIASLSEDFFAIGCEGYNVGVINKKGEVIIDDEYEEISYVSGYFKVKYKGRYGLKDKTGKTVFECIYPEIIETLDKLIVQDFAKLEVPKVKEVNRC